MKIVTRRLVAFLWRYRKEALLLTYFLFIGLASAGIWIFYDHHNGHKDKTVAALAFEEEHQIVHMVVRRSKNTPEDRRGPRVKNRDVDFPLAPKTPTIKAWEANAVTVTGLVEGNAQIAIVIDDLGVVRDKTLAIIDFKAPLTLSFLPYAADLYDVTRLARSKGHELMVHLPMEPHGNMDPGPHALITGVSRQKMLQELSFNLSQFAGYVGFNNHMGSAFTEDTSGLNLILNEAKKRGLLILDSRTSRKSLLAKMATDKDIPNVTRDFFLDNKRDVSYILHQLQKLETMALRRGNAIAIGHPYAETIEALSLWLPSLKEKGITIVPLSYLIKEKYDKILLAKASKLSITAH